MHLSGLWNNQSDQLNHLTAAANQYLQDKILEFFLLNTGKTTFQMKNLTQRWTQLGSFFQNWGTFFDFRKRPEKASPPHPSLVAYLLLQDNYGGCFWLFAAANTLFQLNLVFIADSRTGFCLDSLENTWSSH